MKNIVLASASPRRKDILDRFGVEFEIIPSKIDENFNEVDDPVEVVKSIALSKGRDIAKIADEDSIIIAADTIVYYDIILGKAESRLDAFNMIKSLSGNIHKVITAVAIIDKENNKEIVDYEVTEVKFRDLSNEKIERYLDTEEYVDKAGAYGIQGYGEILVDWVKGSFSNVVGLPISKLDKLLKDNFNIELL